MIGSMVMAVLVVMIALVAFVSDRLEWLKSRPAAIGFLFGLIGIACNTCFPVTLGEFGFCVELRDAPPLVAALFFGPVAGVVAGVITAMERALTPIWGVGAASLCPLATFLTTLYGIAFCKWLTDGNRPTAVQAVLVGAYAEMLHISLDILFNLYVGGVMIEIVYIAIIPETLFIAASAGLASVVCRASENWRRIFRMPLTVVLVLFAAAFTLVTATVMRRASDSADEMLHHALRACEENIDSQIGYMLHCNAVSIANNRDWSSPVPIEQMRRIAAEYDVDELNVIDANGKTVSSNDPSVLNGGQFTRDSPTARPFFDLVDGKRTFVKQRFRAGVDNPGCVAKYIGVPLAGRREFLQLGYFWKRLEREFETFFVPMVAGDGFAQGGYFVIANGKTGKIAGQVKYHPEAEGVSLESIGLGGRRQPGETFTTTVCGKGSRVLCREGIGDWQIYAVLPLIEVYGPANLTVIVAGFVLLVLCTVFRLIELRFRKAQQKVDDLRAQEMAISHAIQTSELRTDNPANDRFGVFASMRTAREVGGDFYDYYELSDGRFVITIADVSGKGVPAAIFMMKAMLALKGAVSGNQSLTEAVETANGRLCSNNAAEMFVTAWVGVYDPATRKLEYVSAGHNPPLLRHADGRVEWVKGRRSLVLAAMDGTVYHSNEMELSVGDRLLLYTDGVTEAMNGKSELFGEARLEKTFAQSGNHFVGEISSAVDAFTAGAEQSDDITMLAFAVKG